VAGVCGGPAEYFNLDPTLIRVLFVLPAVLGGSGVVQPPGRPPAQRAAGDTGGSCDPGRQMR
jgi:hypothetical protein